MDERILFDQFHEALDVEPRPGAYERMRAAMTSHPVALKRRPAFRMRWSKMGLRVAAVIAAAVIAVAMGAVILASHHGPTGSVNATQDPNVKAYQAMLVSDYNAFNASTSNHCNTIQDTGCEAAVKPVVLALQHWLDDLAAFHTTPAPLEIFDGQLRRHLNAGISGLTAAVAFQKAGNQAGFDRSMNAAEHQRGWVDNSFVAIAVTYPKVLGSFQASLSDARLYLDACISAQTGAGDIACQTLSPKQACAGLAASNCESYALLASDQIEALLVGLLQSPAPSALTIKAAQLQAQLAAADTALLSLSDALLSGNPAKIHAGQIAYSQAITAASGDASAIGSA